MQDTLKKICDYLIQSNASDYRLADIRLGLHYAAAVVERKKENQVSSHDTTVRSCGLAATMIHEQRTCCNSGFAEVALASIRNNAGHMLSGLDMDNRMQRVIALATCNAIICLSNSIDEKDELSVSNNNTIWPIEDKNVGMIGYFEPLLPFLKEKARSLRIAEHHKSREEKARETESLIHDYQELSNCDTIIVTATSLINNSFDTIMDYCRHAFVILLGPSAPLTTQVFCGRRPNTGIVAGRKVTDIDRVLNIVSCGGGTPFFKSCTRKVEMSF